MAAPGENSRDFEVRVTKAGAVAIDAEAREQNIELSEVFRRALVEYFEKRGKPIQFTPDKPGGVQRRTSERKTFEQILDRIHALGLPDPMPDYHLGHKVYDLAWPERETAVEISMRKRPAGKNEWKVGHIRPGMKPDRIDAILTQLLRS